MIIDALENAAQYFSLHPSFAPAFGFVAQTNLLLAPLGQQQLHTGIAAIFSYAAAKTQAQSLATFECHNAHIDIHICIEGQETIGWKPRQSCHLPQGQYNPLTDVQLYHDSPDLFFQLIPGQFAILFPNDVHAPMIGEGSIKKLVLKVEV